jgi:non-haem Fe2+, alpha-ketoglutarate-dependent halogenase
VGISYIPASVRTVGSYRLSALLVRGHDTGGHFDQLAPCKSEFGIAELERHERVYRRYRENYAEQTEWHERGVTAA